MRNVKHIDVGTHGNKVGFTMEFEDGEREHHLFDLDAGERLATMLMNIIKQCRYIEAQIPSVPGEGIGISDVGGVGLSTPGGG